MKPFLSTIVFLSCLSLTFISGCSDSDVQIKEVLNQKLEFLIPMVSFCELTQNFSKYDRRIVETSAVLIMGYHGSFLDDEDCYQIENKIWIDSWSQSADDKVHRFVEANLTSRAYSFQQVRVTAVGKFRRQTGFHQNFDFVFDISEVKEIKLFR